MILRAGERGRAVTLTDAQAQRLGLPETPERVGCGKDACVYAGRPGRVVKVTTDAADALALWYVAGLQPPPKWIVPVHVVWRAGGAFVAEVTRVEPLTAEWAEPIDELFDFTDESDDEWAETYRDVLREIEWQEAEHGGASDVDRRMRQALTTVDEGIKATTAMGLFWEDYHSGNWGLLEERPVIIDLGRLDLVSGEPVAERAKAIPVLPY